MEFYFAHPRLQFYERVKQLVIDITWLQFRHFANKLGNLERPFLKDFFPRWVESSGCPRLRLVFKVFNLLIIVDILLVYLRFLNQIFSHVVLALCSKYVNVNIIHLKYLFSQCSGVLRDIVKDRERFKF